jgi:hyperosmotically inducible protein
VNDRIRNQETLMRNHRLLIVAIAATALAGAAACSSTRTQRAPGEHMDDAFVLTSVKSALAADEMTEAHEINVEVNRGVVQLNGFVDSAAEKSRATVVAADVKGVREVQNNLNINPGARSAGMAVDDALLTAKVKAALIQSPDTKAHQITVNTERGVVQLSGFVDSATAKAAATTVAMSVTGVKDVDNELVIKSY